MEFRVPAASGSSSAEHDMVIPAPSHRSGDCVPPLFNAWDFGDTPDNGDGRWFFNMKVHHPPAHNYPPSQAQSQQPAEKPNARLEALPAASRQAKSGKSNKAGAASRKKQPREQSKAATRDQGRGGGAGNAGKPVLNRHRKLQALPTPTPSPSELKELIDIQTARSIGDSVIFHNIPESCDDTPETEVVRFCQDYFVGRRIKHVNFGQVHKMEERFGKEPPIAARFTLALDTQADQSEEEEKKYQPLPYIPPVPRRKLPILKGKNRRKTQYSVDA